MRVSKDRLVAEARRLTDISAYVEYVKPIIGQVRARGDEAIYEFTEKFDGVKLSKLELTRSELEAEASRISNDAARAIDLAMESIRRYHEAQLPRGFEEEYMGLVRGIKWTPIGRVGIYAPKGYFSSLLMSAIPAKVAGVGEIIVATPPSKGSSLVSPEVAYIAVKLGLRVFTIGGAQAVAALAYGTGSVPKVDKIVGPGNVYVQAAKLAVAGAVGIDGVEGPTELVTCAKPGFNPTLVALDLAAQLEHNSALGIILTWDEGYLIRLEAEVGKLTQAQYLSSLVNGPGECIDLINEIAPEHVSLWGLDEYAGGITNAGAVSISVPSALIDYAAGPNHILPTGGSARWRGGLTVLDFMKPIFYVRHVSVDSALVNAASLLALMEGFRAHSESLRRWIMR